jgi:hypothetical protein
MANQINDEDYAGAMRKRASSSTSRHLVGLGGDQHGQRRGHINSRRRDINSGLGSASDATSGKRFFLSSSHRNIKYLKFDILHVTNEEGIKNSYEIPYFFSFRNDH